MSLLAWVAAFGVLGSLPPGPAGTLDVVLEPVVQGPVYVSEAVPVMVRLINGGATETSVSLDCFADVEGSFRVARPDGHVQEIAQAAVLDVLCMGAAPPLRLVLAPGEEASKLVVLSVDWSQHRDSPPIFAERGAYAVSAALASGPRSNVLFVDVLDPPESELAALELLHSPDWYWLIYDPSELRPDEDQDLLDAWSELSRMPGSRVYASYARLALAQVEFDGAIGLAHPGTVARPGEPPLSERIEAMRRLLGDVDPAALAIGFRARDLLAAIPALEARDPAAANAALAAWRVQGPPPTSPLRKAAPRKAR